MADVKISQLPSASTPLAGTEEIPLVQSSTTKKITVSNLLTSANLGTPTAINLANATNVPMAQASGILPVVNGGTGTSTPAIVAGTNVTVSGTWPNQTINATGGGGSGDVSGPASSTDNAVARFDSTTGKIIQNSGVVINDSGEVTVGVWKGTEVGLSYGGTGAASASQARGNILPSYTGNAGKVLAVNTGATDAEWIAAGGTGTVTSVAVSGGTTGLTTSGGPITAAGTITLAGTLAVANGGTGTSTPSLVQGTNVTITGSWPNQTINASSSSQVYPGAGIANSTGTAWGTSYTTTGTGTVVALATAAALTSPSANQINDTNGAQILGLSPTTSAVDYLVVKNGIGVGVPLHLYADGASANTGLHIQPKGTGLVTISDGTDFNKGIRFRSSSSAASAVTLLDAVSTAGRVVTLPDATTTLVGRDTTDTLTNKTINLTSNTLVATSAQMAAAVSDETGSGSLVFATSPTLVTPLLGTPTSGNFSTGTFTWPTFNQNTTGTASNVTGTVAIANGGTGQTTAAAAITALTGTQTSGQYLRSDGTNAALGAIQAGDVPTLNQNTTGSAGSVANALTAGTGISFSAGSTYNGSAAITINNSGVAVYPGAGISVSTGSAWGTSYSTTGSGTVVALATSPSFTTPVLGTPTSGTLSNCTVDGTDSVGFRNIPQNSQSAAYTLVLADAGKHIFHPVGDNNARTFTIPANSSVAYPIGTAITFINMAAANVTIAITTDTMYLSSAGTTGSRTLAQYGSATAIKITSTNWLISGSGLT